jgi:hypothetical protein
MEWIFMAIALVIVARSPFGVALAERIRQGTPATAPRFEEFAMQMTEDVRLLREEVTELAERVDFTERALTAMRRNDALPDGDRT